MNTYREHATTVKIIQNKTRTLPLFHHSAVMFLYLEAIPFIALDFVANYYVKDPKTTYDIRGVIHKHYKNMTVCKPSCIDT